MNKKINNETLLRLLEEALQIEQNVSKLYLLFNTLFPEDSKFWWQLVIEEKNHASLIRSCKESFLSFPESLTNLLPKNLNKLIETNETITALIEKYKNIVPSREAAFNSALKTELSAGELHYQEKITEQTEDKLLEIFQALNEDDKDHAERIKDYMLKNNINMDPDL